MSLLVLYQFARLSPSTRQHLECISIDPQVHASASRFACLAIGDLRGEHTECRAPNDMSGDHEGVTTCGMVCRWPQDSQR